VGVLTELSLFSGYGGFTLGLRLAEVSVQTVCYVENEPYCQALLQSRIRDEVVDDAPMWDDARTFDGEPWRGAVDIITAGFPCQPHSVAGRHRGAADDRNLWPDTLRIIREVGPRFVLLENVPGILARGYGGTVVGQLSEIGYDAEWHCVPAAAVGAPHLRWRWWCLAYAVSGAVHEQRGWGTGTGRTGAPEPSRDGKAGYVAGATPEHDDGPESHEGTARRGRSTDGRDVADASSPGPPERPSVSRDTREEQPAAVGAGWWAVEPDVGRVADGVAYRVDRLRATGNGIVPAVVAKFLTPSPPG
jgi:DNA (cytosine-5)-methyltransferase 1